MLDEQDDTTITREPEQAAGTGATDAAPEASESAAPAPRRRRAARRPAGPAEPQPVFSGGVVEPPPPAEAAGAALAVPLFQPPTEVAPPPPPPADDEAAPARRRRRPRAAESDPSAAAPEGEQSADDGSGTATATRSRSGRRGRGKQAAAQPADAEAGDTSDETPTDAADSGESGPADGSDDTDDDAEPTVRRRRRRRRGGGGGGGGDDAGNNRGARDAKDEVTALKGSTRIEAKRQRRKEGRESGRRRAPVVSEAEFLARRESVHRTMVVRQQGTLTQIVVLEDGVLVEHYVNQATATSLVGNVYLGRVQNVLPSMEAAFVDIGRGRNAVLYAGEVNWDAAGLEGQPKRIEQALSSGDKVLVQVTKDPVGHKGARLTSQISLPGRFIVYVPDGSMTGISRKLPDKERTRLRGILREALPDGAGVIVRTAAEGASEEEITRDVAHLTGLWEQITTKAEKASPPAALHAEPDLALRVVRDIFNSDFAELVVSGDEISTTLTDYVAENAPNLSERVTRWTGTDDVFAHYRVDEQLAKALDRKVYLPSGGSLVIDRTEAMTVVDVNTGRFTGQGGNLEETVTRNNLEAAEEIVRQIRLRDAGGIIVIDFIDMVLESNRDLVLRRLVECLGRDRTKHQVAEVTSLGLVQMTRKRIGQGLLETFSEPCDCCNGRGVKVHSEPVEGKGSGGGGGGGGRGERKPRSVRPPGAHDPVEAAARAKRDDAPTEPTTPPQNADEPADSAPAAESDDSAGTPPDAEAGGEPSAADAPAGDATDADPATAEPADGGLTEAQPSP